MVFLRNLLTVLWRAWVCHLKTSSARYGNNYKHTRLEDATLGLWISPYKKNDRERFALEPSCSNVTILAHQSILNNFKKTTENLIKTGSMCTKKALKYFEKSHVRVYS